MTFSTLGYQSGHKQFWHITSSEGQQQTKVYFNSVLQMGLAVVHLLVEDIVLNVGAAAASSDFTRKNNCSFFAMFQNYSILFF